VEKIQNIVSQKVGAMVKDGTIDGLIQDQLMKTIKECIADAFRSYSPFGKMLSKKIDEAIQAGGRDIDWSS